MSEHRDEELQRFFDGDLNPRRARKVYARVIADPDERKRLEALDELGALVREGAEAAADDADFSHLWARVEAGIEAEEAPAQSIATSPMLRWGIALTSAMAAVVLAVVLLNPLRSAPQRNSCVIESLEVGSGATSTVFTINDSEGRDATTIVWLSEAQGE